jgi:predicted transcriptional regulator
MNKVLRPSIFEYAETPEETARLDSLAEADIEAGRTVSHERVKAWLDARLRGEKIPPPTSDSD